MQLNKAVSYRLIQLLNERNMTAYRLFTQTGISKSAISKIINCQQKSVNLTTLHVFCQGLDITLEEFFRSDLFSNENLDP
ncbi:MAG: helix-turn-helix transcriptional regulator [Clostridia bacterium]|nr:helix-turn-helix transcriptional regulator [Clostridia bacterium]